jgi:hypothetical protein
VHDYYSRRAGMSTKTRATIEDLYKVEGKAESAVPGWRMPVDDLFGSSLESFRG